MLISRSCHDSLYLWQHLGPRRGSYLILKYRLQRQRRYSLSAKRISQNDLVRRSLHGQSRQPGRLGPGGGGGGALRYRGGPHLRYVFRGRRGLFLRPPHVRHFVKEGYFFVLRYEVWGQNPLTIHEIYAALTPSDSRSDWASESAAATCCR